MEHFLSWIPEDPFHEVKFQKYFMHMRVKFAKNFLEKCNPKEDSSKTNISYLSTWHVGGSYIPKRKKISRQQ